MIQEFHLSSEQVKNISEEILDTEFKACSLIWSPVTGKSLSLLTDPLKNKRTTYIVFPTGIWDSRETNAASCFIVNLS